MWPLQAQIMYVCICVCQVSTTQLSMCKIIYVSMNTYNYVHICKYVCKIIHCDNLNKYSVSLVATHVNHFLDIFKFRFLEMYVIS